MSRRATAALALTVACALTACTSPGSPESSPSSRPGGTHDPGDTVQTPHLTTPARTSSPGGSLGPDVGPAAASPQPAPADARQLDTARSELAEDSKYPAFANPEIDTLHHALDLTYRGGRLGGKDTITFRAATDTATVQLSLRDTLTVAAVTLDGRAVTSTRGRDAVIIRTGPLARDSRHVLSITYAGVPTPIPAPSHRGDQGDGLGWVVTDSDVATMSEPYGALTWYPCNDWTADKALYDVRVTTDADVMGVTNGSLTGRTRTPRGTTTTWHLAQPTSPYLMTMAIGDYRWRGIPLSDGKTFNLWHRATDTGTTVDHWADISKTSYEWLIGKLGPFPYDEAGAVVVNQDSAMETSTLVTMGAGAFDAQGQGVLAHELAHQWYGDSVTPRDWKHLWLNEGWAMFIQFEYVKAQGTTSRFRPAAESCRASVAEEGQAGDYKADHFAGGNVYMCGAALLEELQKELGDDEFWAMARAWEDAHAHGTVTRADFETFLSTRYGKDYTPLTRRWLNQVSPG